MNKTTIIKLKTRSGSRQQQSSIDNDSDNDDDGDGDRSLAIDYALLFAATSPFKVLWPFARLQRPQQRARKDGRNSACWPWRQQHRRQQTTAIRLLFVVVERRFGRLDLVVFNILVEHSKRCKQRTIAARRGRRGRRRRREGGRGDGDGGARSAPHRRTRSGSYAAKQRLSVRNKKTKHKEHRFVRHITS